MRAWSILGRYDLWRRESRNFVRATLGVWVVVGVVIASLALWVAFQHNPQDEFLDSPTGSIAFRSTATLWLSWFVLVFGGGSGLSLAFWQVARLLTRRRFLAGNRHADLNRQ